jgi:hypothetical protein
MRAAALDAELIRLHGDEDEAARLSELHEKAAAHFEDNPGARRFQLTHAWVFALVAGDGERVEDLERKLRLLGGL